MLIDCENAPIFGAGFSLSIHESGSLVRFNIDCDAQCALAECSLFRCSNNVNSKRLDEDELIFSLKQFACWFCGCGQLA